MRRGPNVTFDVFALCAKAGSATVLKGGHEAADTNSAAVDIIRRELEGHGGTPISSPCCPTTARLQPRCSGGRYD